jgi:hypothetical protein
MVLNMPKLRQKPELFCPNLSVKSQESWN